MEDNFLKPTAALHADKTIERSKVEVLRIPMSEANGSEK